MALVKFINAIASGKVGGGVYSRNRGGPILRTWRKPSNHQTARQMAARACLANASATWRLMSDAQRSAWTLWATLNKVINRMGDSITLSGISAFNMLAARTIDRGAAPGMTPPNTAAPTAPTSASAVISAAAGTAVVTFTPNPIGLGTRLALWSCGPGKASQDPSKAQAKLIAYGIVNGTSPATFTLPYAVTAGDVVNLWLAALQDNGRLSPFIKLRTTVIA